MTDAVPAVRSAIARVRFLVSGLLALALLLSSALIFAHLQVRRSRQTLDEFQHVSQERADAVQDRVDADLETLHYLGWFFTDDRNSGHDPEWLLREFDSLARDMLAERPRIGAFWWIPLIPDADRAAYARAAASMGVAGADQVLADGSAIRRTLRVFAIDPASPGPSLLVCDLRSNADAQRAMSESRQTGRPRAIPGTLLAEWLRPDEVLVLQSLARSGRAADASAPDGYVGLVLHANRLTQLARSSPLATGFGVSLHEQSDVHGRVLLHDRPAADGAKQETVFEAVTPFDVAGRRWILTTRTGSDFAAARQEWGSWLILVGGIALAAIVWGHLREMGSRSAAVERIVAERTAALSQTIAALERSEERFRLVTRATSDAIWDWNIATDEVWWNDAFGTLFGHHPHEACTRELWISLIYPDDRIRTAAALDEFFASSETAWAVEYRFRRSDGSYAWVFDRGFVVRDRDGAPLRVIGSMMDVTLRKDAERMKSDFVSIVSHQLRTPLSGISWMLELAADSPGVPDPVQSYIVDARLSASRLTALVNDLLDVSRLEDGRLNVEMGPLSLQEITASVVNELRPQAAERGQAVSVIAPEAIPPARADRQLMRQVVLNLTSNAIKYTPSAGTIRITLGQMDGMVQWAVSDSGIGVPREARGRLFEKFFRAENAMRVETEGTGLGLYLVRLIVERHGGVVTCESEEGRGTTFRFTVPVAQALS